MNPTENPIEPNEELTDDQLDNVVGGGKYDAHGHGINHGNGKGPKSTELTDDQLDQIVGGGKYDLHGNGYNSGNGNGKGPKN